MFQCIVSVSYIEHIIYHLKCNTNQYSPLVFKTYKKYHNFTIYTSGNTCIHPSTHDIYTHLNHSDEIGFILLDFKSLKCFINKCDLISKASHDFYVVVDDYFMFIISTSIIFRDKIYLICIWLQMDKQLFESI